MKPSTIYKLFGWIFSVLGIITIAIGIYLFYSENEFRKTNIKKEATITSIRQSIDSNGDVTYHVYIEFWVDGNYYEGRLNTYSSDMYVGAQQTIYYDPENPNNFRAEISSWIYLLLLFMGVIFFFIGSLFFFFLLHNKKRKQKVLSYNYIIQASIVGVKLNRTFQVNGRNPYYIEANYISPIDGKLYTYKSESIWQEVTPILTMRQITTIPVYVNPNNYAQYYVDIQSITQYLGN